jgi:LysR family transcriptional regulator, glycine cleavage system transcriptional activator
MSSRTLPGTRALKVFEAAGRHLNFTRAADEVGLTPAAVSYQVKEIEEQLGFILFERTSRKMKLTPAGTVMLRTVTEVLQNLQRAITQARKTTRNACHLRISLGPRFITNWLLPKLPEFKKENPDLELDFDITDEVRDFDIHDVDIAIRFGTGKYPQTLSDRLFGTVVVPVCSPELLKTGSKLKVPRDLIHHTLCYVDCTIEGEVWPNWSMWMKEAGIDNFNDSQTVAFSDSSHVVQAVLEGGAVGLAEPIMIANELAQGRLIRLFNISLNVSDLHAYHVVYPEYHYKNPAVAAFRHWMLSEASSAKYADAVSQNG